MEVLKIKRVYEPPEKGDGVRVLVDRSWPRGLSKGLSYGNSESLVRVTMAGGNNEQKGRIQA